IERRPVGEVERERPHRAAGMGLFELSGERLGRLCRGPVGEVDVEAPGHERAYDRSADALGAAGDEDAPCGFAAHAGSAAKTRQVFCPPKPKELESTRPTFASRATFGTTSSGIVGSGTL